MDLFDRTVDTDQVGEDERWLNLSPSLLLFLFIIHRQLFSVFLVLMLVPIDTRRRGAINPLTLPSQGKFDDLVDVLIF